ncbi:c-type cytochrome [Maioricimonas sp. JC845]|uniref:c-type cytochrome n=1 Tax=Maioricimonas sp. JC845 TaxID=3232138 RepID=UPI0034579A20
MPAHIRLLIGGILITAAALPTLPASAPAADPPATPPVPDFDTDLPPGPLGETVRLGRDIVDNTNTHPLSRKYVGNTLTCSSCHLDAGTDPQAGTFLGTALAYPAWSPREQRVITLEDRALNCFMRSMNGTRPPNGSRVSVAITAYITWLSQGQAMRMNPEKPLGPHSTKQLDVDPAQADLARGRQLYIDRCADCHGADGLGTDDGPPVWGPESYNDGAGLSRVPKLTSWLKAAMPLGDPDLTTQQALDIAAFVNSHSRPKFVLEEHLPPPERRGEYNAEP